MDLQLKKIAVFASGRGSNYIKIYENIKRGEIPAEVCCMITDNASAMAIDFSKSENIPVFINLKVTFSLWNKIWPVLSIKSNPIVSSAKNIIIRIKKGI